MNFTNEEIEIIEKELSNRIGDVIKPLYKEIFDLYKELNELIYILCFKGILSKEDIKNIKKNQPQSEES